MFETVKIGSKSVPMLSKASVDVYYEQIFHQDPIALQFENSQDAAFMIAFTKRMGFVMAKFAEAQDSKEMDKLNNDSFLRWLDGFERAELLEALPAIQAVYEGQSDTQSEAKKNTEEPTGE